MEAASFAELREAGERHYITGDYGEAVRAFRKASDMVPTSAETLVKLGFACTADGNMPEAIGAFKQAIGLDPQNHEAFLGVGLAYMANADFARAISSFDSALELRPNDARAKDELVKALSQEAMIRLGANDHYGGEALLERAYRLSRTNPDTVVPYVEHLVGSNQHKKAFDVINQARKDAPNDAKIAALGERMDNDPKLAHAKQIASLRADTRPGAIAAPAKPAVNPDEVPCPCGATRVMKWAQVCPTCSNRIGAPQGSSFSGHEKIRGTTWIDVAYYIVAGIWLVTGIVEFVLGYTGVVYFEGVVMTFGVINFGIALGLLFQVEWVQFIAKIFMMLNAMLFLARTAMALGLSLFLEAAVCVFALAVSAFSAWVIGQMSD